MSIGSLINKNTYLGNASTGTYNYNFKIFKKTELKVIVKDPSSVESILSDSAYTVTGVKNSSGGTIVLVGPASYLSTGGFLLSGFELIIKRDLDLVQETDIRNQGDFFPEVHEDVFDRQTMVDQQLQEQIDRSIKMPESAKDFKTVLPTKLEGSANVTIATDPTGKFFVVGPTTDQIVGASAAAAASAASATAASASATSAAGSVVASAASATSAAASAASAANTLASSSGRVIVFLTTLNSPVNVLQANNGTLYVCDTGDGPIVFNLPSIAGLLLPFNISIKLEAGLNPITVNRAGTDTIGGQAVKQITALGGGTFLFADASPTPDNWTDINFGVSAGNYTVQRFNGNGVTTTFPLSVTPSVEENIDVYINGIYQQKNTFNISGMSLLFSEAPLTGTENIEVKIGTTLGIGVPSDNTLSTAKYINGSITNEKMALGAGWTTGDLKPTFKNVADPSWVLLDDGTIGSATSGATTRANADTLSLFTLLWNNLPDTLAVVSGGRGVSAAADFGFNKTLTLSKALGRVMGVAGTGFGLTSRALGESVGAELHALTISEMPTHNHFQDPHAHNYLIKNGGGARSATGGSFNEVTNVVATDPATATNQATGGSAPHNNMQPSFFVNVMIKL